MPEKAHLLPEHMTRFTLIFSRNVLLVVTAISTLVLFPIGVWLFTNNSILNETRIDYTYCKVYAGREFSTPPANLSTGIARWRYDQTTTTCTAEFNVEETITSKVRMYVRITNMYQNHRLYVKSLDVDQLKGKIYEKISDFPSVSSTATTNCAFLLPANCDVQANFRFNGNGLTFAQNNPDCRDSARIPALIRNADREAQYYPCGLIANSMFSDTISPLQCVGASCRIPTFEFSQIGIAWPEDASQYAATKWNTSERAALIPTRLIPPPQWRQAWPELWGNGYNQSNLPDLKTWERFHVWMRKAALPTFRKLWGLNNTQNLDRGTWQVSIIDRTAY
jgi:hypothetical protein